MAGIFSKFTKFMRVYEARRNS